MCCMIILIGARCQLDNVSVCFEVSVGLVQDVSGIDVMTFVSL